jgi:Fe-S cluster assembly protein SufD
MTAEISNDVDSFKLMLEKAFSENQNVENFQSVKNKAWALLQEIGLPTRKTEVFQYIRLRTLYNQSFELAQAVDVDFKEIESFILPECKDSVLVIVNGLFSPSLSRVGALPKRLVIQPLHTATKTYGSFINNQWNKILKEDKDAFSLLNAALFQDGLFIYAPPKTLLETPIQILHVSAYGNKALITTPRIHGYVGAQSQLEFVTTHASLSGNEGLFCSAIDLSIDEDSHVKIIQSSFDLNKETWYFEALRASLKRNSTLKTIMATAGNNSIRHDYRVALAGENAEAQLNGIWMLSENNEAHAHILMEHQAPNCRSMQLFKGTLDDTSRSSFEGKIYVHRAAQKTEAFQLNNNLLLSDKAKADSKPNLEIFADDVKASHGATVGQLDSEQLFYLKTRGFSESAAKNILVYGFCKQVLDMISIDSINKQISLRAKNYLLKN